MKSTPNKIERLRESDWIRESDKDRYERKIREKIKRESEKRKKATEDSLNNALENISSMDLNLVFNN